MATKAAIRVNRLGDILGGEVVGANMADPADEETYRAVHAALLDHGVVCIRDQALTPAQHIAFSRRFGELDIHVLDQFLMEGYPEILYISNKKVGGRPLGLEDAGRYWHSDVSYGKVPPMGSLLYAVEIPPEGGDTLFANMYAAYSELSDGMKARLAGLKAIHRYGDNYARMQAQGSARPDLTEAQRAMTPDAVHPVVRTHPETGRKALYVNPGFTVAIADMDPEQGRKLLAELFRHATRPRFIYRHRWRLHDVLFWDNRCTMHCATGYDPKHTRHMHRTTVRGDLPY